MSKAFKVTIDDNRSIIGRAFHGGVTFQFRNVACVTRLSLSYAAINSMGQIAEAVKAAEEKQEGREAEVERLRDVERRRVAEGMSAWCSSGGEHAAKTGEVELMTNAARLIREVIGRDLNRRRRFGMYQDQTDDLWKVVDLLEAAGKVGKEPAK